MMHGVEGIGSGIASVEKGMEDKSVWIPGLYTVSLYKVSEMVLVFCKHVRERLGSMFEAGDSAPLDVTRGGMAPQSRNTGKASPSMLQDGQGREAL